MTSLPHQHPPLPYSDDDPPPGGACAHCGAGLAPDQRWCLECGARRPELASPFASPAPAMPPPPVRPPLAAGRAARPVAPPDGRPQWLMGAVVAGVSALLFAIGLLVGLAGRDPRTMVNVPAAKAPVVNVSVPAGGAAVAGAPAEAAFTSDWPDGKDGYTVQLQALPKDATQPDAVAAAKKSAEDAGASDVGALDSDEYASLKAGSYVVYSGVLESKASAAKALKKLKRDFKKAKVIQVSATGGDDGPTKTVSKSDLRKQQNLSPDEFQKQSKKLPDKIGTEGKPPAPDKKPAGGGSQGTEIG